MGLTMMASISFVGLSLLLLTGAAISGATDVFGHQEGARVRLTDEAVEASIECPCETRTQGDGSVRVFAGALPSFFACTQRAPHASAGLVLGMHATFVTGVPPVIEDLLMPRGHPNHATDTHGFAWGTNRGAVHNVTTLRAVFIVIDFPSKSYNASAVRLLAENSKDALQRFVSTMNRRFNVPIAGEFMLTDTCMGRHLCKHYFRHDRPGPNDENGHMRGCRRIDWRCGVGCGVGQKERSLDPSLLKLKNFKNSAAYMFGVARVGAFARYVVHVDTDWTVQLVPQSAWAASALSGTNWIERAVSALKRYAGAYIIEVGGSNRPPYSKADIERESKRCTCDVSLQAFVLDTNLFRDRLLPFSFGHTEGALFNTCMLRKEHGDKRVCTLHFWGSSVLGVQKRARG